MRGRSLAALLALSLWVPLITVANAQDNLLNDSLAYQGREEYQKGNYQRAYELFSEALQQTPDDPKILQSLGSAAFKLNQLDQAARAFEGARKSARSAERKFDASYDLGTTHLAAKKYQEAIDAFDQALSIQPKEPKALHNRAIAEALLKQKEEEKDDQSSSSSSSSSSESSSSSSEQQQSQSESSSAASEENHQQNSEESTSAQSSSQQSARGDSSASASSQSQNSSDSTGDEQKSEGSSSAGDEPHSSMPAAEETGAARESSPTRPQDSTPLSEREAREWLKALPESPLLMQRLNKRERKPPGGQLW